MDVNLPQPTTRAQVDPRFQLFERLIHRYGRQAPIFGPTGATVDARLDGAGALLRFSGPLSTEAEADLESIGVELRRNARGQVSRIGAIYHAWIRFSALDALHDFPGLLRAEATWAPITLKPLEETIGQIGAYAAHLGSAAQSVTGDGVLIADVDSGVDVLHPHFFRADAGYYAWLDVNESGAFEPGVDAVDLDHDGKADLNESLLVLDGTFLQRFDQDLENRDGELSVVLDWLFADMNRDGVRNVGRAQGFTEDDPAYGEAIFVVDDADHDGRLDPEEKLVRLGTSKIVQVVDGDQLYRRGENLIDAVDAPGFSDSFHGTGVASILVGGQSPFHERVGVAPGAELLMYTTRPAEGTDDFFEESAQFDALADSLERGATLMLHEWTNPYSVPHDGSGNYEAAMDEARRRGQVQVNPVGNLNLADKHVERDIPAGGVEALRFEIGDGFTLQGDTYPYSIAYLSLSWQGSEVPVLELENPSGETMEVALNADPDYIGATADVYSATHEVTSRGTHHTLLILWSEDGEDVSISRGTWTLRVSGLSEATHLQGRVADYYSGWAKGVVWVEPTRDRGTVVYPSTADSALGVAAYGGRWDDDSWDDSRVGELRNYSGRGPRIDGEAVVDIAAPDDPFAAMAALPEYIEVGWGRSWFMTFGGTSGAGPHVAGAMALLMELYPDASPDELETRLIEAARNDALSPEPADALPDIGWGYGKLDVYAALFGVEVPARTSSRPSAGLVAERREDVLTLDASSSSDPDGDTLNYRFDVNYDGVWETDWQASPRFEVALEAFADATVARVAVKDPGGFVSGAVSGIAGVPDTAPEDMGGGSDASVVEQPPPKREPTCATVPVQAPEALLLLLGLWGMRRRR